MKFASVGVKTMDAKLCQISARSVNVFWCYPRKTLGWGLHHPPPLSVPARVKVAVMTQYVMLHIIRLSCSRGTQWYHF